MKMKGIRQRGDAWVYDVSHQGARKTGTAVTMEEAILARRQALADLKQSPVVELAQKAKGWTLAHAIDVTVQTEWRGSDWGTRAEANARHLERLVGRSRSLDSIDKHTLDLWVSALEKEGKSDGTINRYLASVSKVMTVAQDHNALVGKPKFPRRRETEGRIRQLSPVEEQKCLDTLEPHQRSPTP
jgi:hypothetical protein